MLILTIAIVTMTLMTALISAYAFRDQHRDVILLSVAYTLAGCFTAYTVGQRMGLAAFVALCLVGITINAFTAT